MRAEPPGKRCRNVPTLMSALIESTCEHCAERPEPKFRDQPLQTELGLAEIAVVPEVAQTSEWQPGLPRIELPRMDVEDGGLALDLVQPGNTPARPRIGKQPEVPAAGNRQIDRT